MKTRVNKIICGKVTENNEETKAYAFVSALKGLYSSGMVLNYVKQKRFLCDVLQISRNTLDKYLSICLKKEWIIKHQQIHLKLKSKDELAESFKLKSNKLKALKKEVNFTSLNDLILEINEESLRQVGFKQERSIKIKSKIINNQYACKSNSNMYGKSSSIAVKKESRKVFHAIDKKSTLSSFQTEVINPTITFSCQAFARHLGKSRATGSRRRRRLAMHNKIKVEKVNAIEIYSFVQNWEEFQEIKDKTKNKSIYYSPSNQKVYERQCSRVSFI